MNTREGVAERESISRRHFLQTTALALPAASLAGCGGLLADGSDQTGNQRVFFSEHEYQFSEAATMRLIPSDEQGPGAKEAMIVVFIDRQLAGPYGRAETW